MAMAKGRRRLLAAAVFLLVLAACTSTAGRPDPGTGPAGTRPGPANQYAARHDAFAFFRSVTGNQAYCDAHILSFRPAAERPGPGRTPPAFSWISPNLCDDGHDSPCVTGAPGGLAHADAFLSQWVPTIMAGPAYRDRGLIVVTFDEGSNSAACCGEVSGFGPDHPNVPLPGKSPVAVASARSCGPP